MTPNLTELMTLDIRQFFQVTNPGKALNLNDETDRKYYIDFSSVRGGQMIAELRDNITFFSPDEPTCELFTGHIGCGKSTELMRLRMELEEEGFYVVYFESSEDLEMGDVDISDILLAIARRVSESLESLEQVQVKEPKGLKDLLKGAAKLLQTEITLSGEASLPGIGTVSGNTDGDFSAEVGLPGIGKVTASKEEGIAFVATGIGKIAANVKDSPEARSRLRQYLEPQVNRLMEVINEELLGPAIDSLKTQGKNGLVVIVDNLDRLDSSQKPWGRPQPEYLFVDRGAQLRGLHCHSIYTLPLALRFSNDYSRLTQRFSADPKVLPMVPIQLRNGDDHQLGMAMLRQMVLARAFPDLSPEERMDRVEEVFDDTETLDRLCRASGGHARNLLRFLNTWIKKERKIPLSKEGLEGVIRARRNELSLTVSDDEWELLRQVKQSKRVAGDADYQTLIRSMLVYEYRDEDGSWFEVNPILAEAEELR